MELQHFKNLPSPLAPCLIGLARPRAGLPRAPWRLAGGHWRAFRWRMTRATSSSWLVLGRFGAQQCQLSSFGVEGISIAMWIVTPRKLGKLPIATGTESAAVNPQKDVNHGYSSELSEQLNGTGVGPAFERHHSASCIDRHRTQEIGQLARGAWIEATIGASSQTHNIAGKNCSTARSYLPGT